MSQRCTGHCCKNFPLPRTIEELRENWLLWRTGKHAENPAAIIEDIDLIYPMVIPLGVDRNGTHRYTCKHLLANGDCSIYIDRPRMCSEYPYGHPCDHDECTGTDSPRSVHGA